MSENEIGINVSIDPASVQAIGTLIMGILESENDQGTKQEALKILPDTLKIKNVTIHSDHIDQSEAKEELEEEKE